MGVVRVDEDLGDARRGRVLGPELAVHVGGGVIAADRDHLDVVLIAAAVLAAAGGVGPDGGGGGGVGGSHPGGVGDSQRGCRRGGSRER